MCISVHLSTSLYIYIHVYTSIYIYVNLYASTYIYICLFTFMCTYISVYIYIYTSVYKSIYIHIYTYVLCRLASYFETDILSRNTHPPSHFPSTKPSGRSPTPVVARYPLRPDEHPRTTKAVAAEATASHRCSRQPKTRALCALVDRKTRGGPQANTATG